TPIHDSHAAADAGWKNRQQPCHPRGGCEGAGRSELVPGAVRGHGQQQRGPAGAGGHARLARPDHRRGRPVSGVRRCRQPDDCGRPHELRGQSRGAGPRGRQCELQTVALRPGENEGAGMKRYSSLRRKLTALIAGGGIVTALIAAAGFSWLDVHRFWESTNAEVFAISSIVADQVEPAIALGDRKAAAEILDSLLADRTIRDAVIYDAHGVCFARMNSPAAPCPPLPPDGLHPQQDAVVLSANVPSMAEVLRQYLGGAALIVALSLMVAAVLAMVLQSRVSAPILA